MNPDRPDNLEEQLSAYLDNELTDAERAQVEAYLAANEGARRTLAELKRNADLLRSLPRAKAPDGLLELISSQMERDQLLGSEAFPSSAPRPPRRGVGTWLASAAVILLAASAGFLTFTHLRQGPSKPTPAPIGPVADAGLRSDRASGRKPASPRETVELGDEAKLAKKAAPAASPTPALAMRPKTDERASKTLDEIRAKAASAPAEMPPVALAKDTTEKLGTIAVAQPTPALIAKGRSMPGASAATTPARAPVSKSGALAKGSPADHYEGVAQGAAPEQTQQQYAIGGGYAGVPIADADHRVYDTHAPFEIELVYADAAARDAATATMEETLRRTQGTWKAPQTAEAVQSLESQAPQGDAIQPPALHVIATPDTGDNLIIVNASPAVAESAMQAIEDAGQRTQPISLSAQDGEATSWPAVQNLGRAYFAAKESSFSNAIDRGADFGYHERTQQTTDKFESEAAEFGRRPATTQTYFIGKRTVHPPASQSAFQQRLLTVQPSPSVGTAAPAPATTASAIARRIAPATAPAPAANIPLAVMPSTQPIPGQAGRPMQALGQQQRHRFQADERESLQLRVRLIAAPAHRTGQPPLNAEVQRAASKPGS